MKFKYYINYVIRLLLLAVLIYMLTACNNSNDQFSPNTNVSLAPASYTWNVYEMQDALGECIYNSEDYQDNIVVITVSDSSDRPIGEMTLELYMSPSESTSNPALNLQHVFYLYDDFNGNGVIDHPEELVSAAAEPILYETETEKYHGTKTMIVRTNTSCGGFRGTLHAYAGDGHGSMEIHTEASNDDDDDDDDDDDGDEGGEQNTTEE
jgi:hypothetical protein